VDAILARGREALAEPHADLLTELRRAGAVNVDETGWRTAGERRALWGIFDQCHAILEGPEPTRFGSMLDLASTRLTRRP
jgi:hypothetical protein